MGPLPIHPSKPDSIHLSPPFHQSNPSISLQSHLSSNHLHLSLAPFHHLLPPSLLTPNSSSLTYFLSLLPQYLLLLLLLAMAATSLRQSFLHHHLQQPQQQLQYPFAASGTSHDSIFFKPATRSSFKLYANITNSAAKAVSSPPTPTASSSTGFDALAAHLAAGDFRQADEETRRLLIALAGEAAQKRGYVFFSETQFIAAADLQAIDRLWRQHSGGRFGYAVQRRLWEKSGRDFTRFFIRVGWMKKLEDSEVEQYNYRSFPAEFIWELEDGTPQGHLPLTNALRGTQLLASILTHPAFEQSEEDEAAEEDKESGAAAAGDQEKPKLLGANRIFKTDYSF